jgi:hypothetical protein
MSNQPVPDDKKHRVFCTIRSKERTAHYIVDLLWIVGVPILVLEWADVPDGECPAVTVALERRFLKVIAGGKYDLMYEVPVQDPRSPA